MCTVTFLPRASGYCLAMNRDEQRTRAPGLPPSRHRVNGVMVVHPSEPAGGTWISLNDASVTFALVNWYAVAGRVRTGAISRGQVVMATRIATTAGQVQTALEQLPLARINPFRLIGVFPSTHRIVEWRWNLCRLQTLHSQWTAQQWISSGLDEPAAQRIRSWTFRQAKRQRSFGTLDWLRRLHRSHAPSAGPFSICMHRGDAVTVSYTEVTVTPRTLVMRHQLASPCQGHPARRWSALAPVQG